MQNKSAQATMHNVDLELKQDKKLASEVAELLVAKGMTLATAESCTGGAIGALLTSLACLLYTSPSPRD